MNYFSEYPIHLDIKLPSAELTQPGSPGLEEPDMVQMTMEPKLSLIYPEGLLHSFNYFT